VVVVVVVVIVVSSIRKKKKKQSSSLSLRGVSGGKSNINSSSNVYMCISHKSGILTT